MDERQCEHVTRTSGYDDNGRYVEPQELPCHYITDVGETLCPRHKLEREIYERANDRLSEV